MLTVLMATYEGADTLPEVLEGYRHVREPRGGWRLVVADDGSLDGSGEMVAAAASAVPVEVVRLPHRGQSEARNASLPRVEGDLVVLTDDDAVPRPDCLVRLREAADAHPEAAIFGASIRPRWRRPPPSWILDWVRLSPTYALHEFVDDEPIPPEQALGPCFAVRRRVFDDGARFDERIGPDGSDDYPMGSETDFLLRLGARGLVAIGVPDAGVEHIVLPHQMTEDWILARAERYGRGRVRLDAVVPERLRSRRDASALRAFGRLWKHRLSLLVAAGTGDARRRFKALWHLRFLAGAARERRLLRAVGG